MGVWVPGASFVSGPALVAAWPGAHVLLLSTTRLDEFQCKTKPPEMDEV